VSGAKTSIDDHKRNYRRLFGIVGLALRIALPEGASATAEPVPPELDVGATFPLTETVFGLTVMRSDICSDAAGNFVVTWSDGHALHRIPGDAFARRFDKTGIPLGPAFQVNTTVAAWGARVACDPTGGFTVVWSDLDTGTDGDGGGIFGRRFDETGTALGTEYQINTVTAGNQRTPVICSDAAGGTIVGWLSEPAVGDADIVLQRYDAAGVPLGGEVVAQTVAGKPFDDRYQGTAIGCDALGNVVLAWLERPPDASADRGWDVWARRYDAALIAVEPEFLVSGFYIKAENVDVAMAPSGEFAIVWEYIVARMSQYDALGQAVSSNVSLACRGSPSVSMGVAGNVLVVGGCAGADGESGVPGIRTHRFDVDGNSLGDTMRINTARLGAQELAVAAFAPDGDHLVVWMNTQPNPNVLAAQFFCDPVDPECDVCPGHDDTLDTDADGAPDGCDVCVNAGGGQVAGDRAKLALVRLDGSGTYGYATADATLSLRADFSLASGTDFAAFDPITDGARILVTAEDGGTIADARLPAGAFVPGEAGWKVNRTGTKWKYKDQSGSPVRGIVNATVLDRSNVAAPGAVRVKARGKRSIYPALMEDVPLKVDLVLGDESASQLGGCGTVQFTGGECIGNAESLRINCRR